MPGLLQSGRLGPATATTSAVAPNRFALRRIGLRQIPAVVVLALLGWLTWDKLTTLDTARIGAALHGVGPGQWALGTLFTGVSFWAVGQYDAVVHRLLGTPVTQAEAVHSGAAAIAVAQTLGVGAVTGALARWRLLPQLSLIDAGRVALIVALSFLAGWAVLAALAALLIPLPLPGARIGASAVLATAAGLVLLSLFRPAWTRALPAPSLSAMATILGLAALDTLAAGTVLWVLLPRGIDIALAPVLAAYLLALGAGLVLTTPGGVGPFELALITLLPGLPQESVLAAVIAYRLLYYALPALLGAAVLMRGPAPSPDPSRPTPPLDPLPPAPDLPFLVEAVIDAAPRAEAGLLRHGQLGVLADRAGRPLAMAAETGQSLLLLCDPLRRDTDPGQLLGLARARAKARFRSPVFYKIGARMAVAARARGWAVAAVAEEAWLDPRGFSVTGTAHRQLRRKLRKAVAAGITVTEVAPEVLQPLPLAEMAAIADDWTKAHRGERGFSMGRWDPAQLYWPRVYLAHDAAGLLQGFITVHANAGEHTLDLMRPASGAPEGTMQALITAAIESAGRRGRPRFSLAAVPLAPDRMAPAALRWARARLARRAGAAGLRQFKSAFAPHWERRYAAAPTRRSLALGGIDLAREIACRSQPRS